MSLLVEESLTVFFILTILIAGGAAWMSGRALALGWRPYWNVLIYMTLLGLADRFFHWALFEGTLLSLHYYIVDAAVLVAIASLSYRITRTHQMVTQYRWLYRRTSPLSWTNR
ncbi:hypothetical protein MnTg02_00661 [bacterium MnTg02]|nr:hypothetical protein MnTg02_00661 [bacterium MnTg02]